MWPDAIAGHHIISPRGAPVVAPNREQQRWSLAHTTSSRLHAHAADINQWVYGAICASQIFQLDSSRINRLLAGLTCSHLPAVQG